MPGLRGACWKSFSPAYCIGEVESNLLQVKSLARQLYEEYFREAEATPRGVVAKLKTIVKQLDSALAIQIGHLRVRDGLCTHALP